MRDTFLVVGGVILLIVLLAVGYRIVSIAIGPVTIGLQPPTSNSTNPTGPVAQLQPIATKNTISRSMFAVLVGVTDTTAFSTEHAKDYTYMESVSNVDEAIAELRTVFEWNDLVYVVHVPNLRVTPGIPGACRLSLSQVHRLAEYPLGWIIGGDNIVPDEFEGRLEICYNQ